MKQKRMGFNELNYNKKSRENSHAAVCCWRHTKKNNNIYGGD